MQVLLHWACQKISASLQQPDEELKDVLRAKLQTYRGIRYSLIAGHAESVGRKRLATLLLEYETCAADQVDKPSSPFAPRSHLNLLLDALHCMMKSPSLKHAGTSTDDSCLVSGAADHQCILSCPSIPE